MSSFCNLSLSPLQTHNEAGLPTALVRYHSCRVNVPLTVFTCTVVQAVGKYYAIGTSHGLILVFGEWCVCGCTVLALCLMPSNRTSLIHIILYMYMYMYIGIQSFKSGSELNFMSPFPDSREQLKCVLNPYQHHKSATDSL